MIIEIFDPAMCCPSGVCGPSVDPKLVKLQETLRLLQEKCGEHLSIARHGLSSDPKAFVEHAAAAKLLREEGPQCLPLTFVDGKLVARGNYLSPEEFQAALAERGAQIDLRGKSQRAACCKPGCC